MATETGRLTANKIKNAERGKHFDGRGLYLDVRRKDARYWRLKYRFGGRENLLAFGTYPEVSLAEARDRRSDARRFLRDGISLAVARNARRLPPDVIPMRRSRPSPMRGSNSNVRNGRTSPTARRSTSRIISMLPHALLDSSNWHQRSGTAIELLWTWRASSMATTGDLWATLKVLRKRGWTRGATINAAVHELLHYGLIELTRQGGLNRASLYALTWLPIDECGESWLCLTVASCVRSMA